MILLLYPGPVSRKSRKVFGPEKPYQKSRSALFTELIISTGLHLNKAYTYPTFRNEESLCFAAADF